MTKIGFIGAGNMGSALARAAAQAENTELYIYDKDEKKAKALAKDIGGAYLTNKEIAKTCNYIFMAVKPNIVALAAAEIKDIIKDRCDCAIVSMAAGVSIASIEEAFSGANAPIIRIMPNTPAAVGCGMTVFSKNGKVTDALYEEFVRIMAKSGELDAIPESLIDAASAVSGCGPAFVYMFIEALADGGVECGLPREKSLAYAAQTLLGAAEMLKESGKHPGELKDAVCSPGGSTIAGVHALESGAFRATAQSAVVAAYKKTLTLGK